MVDVYKSVTFTLWLCGCNLRCPFCHNWHLAVNDQLFCRPLDMNDIIEHVKTTKNLIDYLHITGGEPIIQFIPLSYFLRKIREIGVRNSINTNLTLVNPLKKLIEENLIDHIATDLKSPHRILYGHDIRTSDKLWEMFLKGLELVRDSDIPLELRIPVPRKLVNTKEYLEDISEALSIIKNHRRIYVIVQPLLGYPVTDPRDKEWCSEYCDPEPDELENVASFVRKMTGFQVIIKRHVSL